MVRELRSFSELEDLMMQIPDTQLVVLDCYASWCGPCKKMGPIFENIASHHPSVIFRKADVEKIPDIATEFNVTSMPTIIFLKDIRVIDKVSGPKESEIEDLIQKYN